MSEHMAGDTEKLFVYGTLLPGHGNYRLIESHVQNAQVATIEGVLVDLGAFPALVPGDGVVNGVVLEVGEVALHIADRLEGYQAHRTNNLYLRKKVEASVENGGRVTVWAYEFADPSTIADRDKCIVGDVDDKTVYGWPHSLEGACPGKLREDAVFKGLRWSQLLLFRHNSGH
jgi:gamma-glutamylcyclotransferase (GGCT)/AIG2-like uncharacterized protein YtfP